MLFKLTAGLSEADAAAIAEAAGAMPPGSAAAAQHEGVDTGDRDAALARDAEYAAQIAREEEQAAARWVVRSR